MTEQTDSTEPAAEPQSPELVPDTAVLDALARIETQLEESQRLLGRHAEVSAKLHAENQVLRGGELRMAQTPLVLSVLRVYDDISRMAETTDNDATRGDLEIAAGALEDALARNGVETVFAALGETFSPSKHKVSAVVETADEAADRTVARVVRPGFAWADGDTVRVSEVAVHKFTPPAEPLVADDDVDSPITDPAAL